MCRLGSGLKSNGTWFVFQKFFFERVFSDIAWLFCRFSVIALRSFFFGSDFFLLLIGAKRNEIKQYLSLYYKSCR